MVGCGTGMGSTWKLQGCGSAAALRGLLAPLGFPRVAPADPVPRGVLRSAGCFSLPRALRGVPL